ncbi:hypothetical protein HYV11_01575 [Candidatus Dependentiae bacterium]|nr:hypothetical protein [Candidatus Dependentiae bacterium]
MCSEMKCAKRENLVGQMNGQIFLHELAHHLPYATLSVACALMVLSLIDVFFQSGIIESTLHIHSHGTAEIHQCCHPSGMDILFHSFHFTHILFAVTGAMMMFYRYSKNIIVGMLVAVISSSLFCTLSDVLLPYLAGRFLGIDMELHICFFSELSNILPFLLVGTVNGLVMSYIKEFHSSESSLKLHFLHTLVSAMASSFYAIGHGFADYYAFFGLFFLLILVAVVLPCTLSDVIVPIVFARMVGKK